MSGPVEPPLGITPQPPPRLVVGGLVGGVSCFAGLLAAVSWPLIRFVPSIRATVPPLPMFDSLRMWHGPFVGAMQLVVAVLLLVVGWGLLSRRRWAPGAFLLTGWGGLLFTALAFWPGHTVRSNVRLLMSFQRKSGAIPPDATFLDLVPPSLTVGLVGFVVVWLGLLLAGTVHVIRRRDAYTR
jgi:hypothetical protein